MVEYATLIDLQAIPDCSFETGRGATWHEEDGYGYRDNNFPFQHTWKW